MATRRKASDVVSAPDRRVIGDIIDHRSPYVSDPVSSTRSPATMQQGHGVPSFGSFKPQAAERERSKKTYRNFDPDSKFRHHYHREVPKEARKNKDISVLEKAAIPVASELFVIDHKGDLNSARYGPSKHNTPKYSTGVLYFTNIREFSGNWSPYKKTQVRHLLRTRISDSSRRSSIHKYQFQ